MAAFASTGCESVRPDALVEHVHFEGGHRASPEALRHLSDIRNGDTVWSVDLEAAERGVERHPWVRRATARVERPSSVVVELEEFEPVALLRMDDLYYVDARGAVFLRAQPDDLDYPVISGVTEALERAHPDLPRLVIRDALWLMDQLDRTALVERASVSEVAFSARSGFTVVLTGGGAELAFRLDDLSSQLERLEALVREGVDLRRPLLVDLAPRKVAIVRPLRGVGSG